MEVGCCERVVAGAVDELDGGSVQKGNKLRGLGGRGMRGQPVKLTWVG